VIISLTAVPTFNSFESAFSKPSLQGRASLRLARMWFSRIRALTCNIVVLCSVYTYG
jgi:hypothetical protein